MVGSKLLARKDPVDTAKTALDQARRNLASVEARREEAVSRIEKAQTDQRNTAAAMADEGAPTTEALSMASLQLRNARDLLAAIDAEALPRARQNVETAELGLAQAERAKIYTAAEQAAAEARAQLVADYPKLVERFAALQLKVAAADRAVAEANAALPEGSPVLATVEAPVRDLDARPAERRRLQTVQLWAYAVSGEPVPEDRLDRISARDGSGTGRLHSTSTMATQSKPVERRPFVEIEERAARSSTSAGRIADLILPPLKPVDEEAAVSIVRVTEARAEALLSGLGSGGRRARA